MASATGVGELVLVMLAATCLWMTTIYASSDKALGTEGIICGWTDDILDAVLEGLELFGAHPLGHVLVPAGDALTVRSRLVFQRTFSCGLTGAP